MKPWRLLASALFVALAAFLMVQGVELKLQGDFGPGPGFMPFIVGAALAAVAVVWGVCECLAPATPMPDELLPDREGLVKVLGMLAALGILASVLTTIGFSLAMFAFLLVAQLIYGRDHLSAKIVVAFACSFGIQALFEQVLRVPLPTASIEALAGLGF